jgi:hypothetical protein
MPTLSRRRRLLLILLLAILLWLPRGLVLDRFVAVDERSWMTRSGNFYLALATGDFAATYQYYHPGVTTMWIGALAYRWQYPDYPAEATGQIRNMNEGIEDRLVAHGHAPVSILATARALMVAVIVLLLLVAFWLAMDLLGWLPALVGLLLLGFDPLSLGLTRMLHVDGLSSTLMLVAVLALMRFYAPTPRLAGQRRDLILSAVMAGLAWLTKSPALILGPMAFLIVAFDLWRRWRLEHALPRRAWGRALWTLIVWGGVAALVFVLCWPAMWVRPIANIRSILSAAGEYAEESNQQIFFNGAIIQDDPGPFFYPITYLWHVTPVTLIGLGLALIAGIVGLRRRAARRQNGAILLLYALLFTALMTFGSKKIDRYLLPAYFPLALVAGLGWGALVGAAERILLRMRHSEQGEESPSAAVGEQQRGDSSSQTPGYAPLRERNDARTIGWLGSALLLIVFVTQAALVLPHFPYYFTFYDPLLGGITAAPKVLMIGLGEGIDEAARYLNAKPAADKLRVASWYRGGSFNYIFHGQDLNIDQFYDADYAVLYLHQWQRQVPNAQMLHYFAQLTPDYTVNLHGLDYAWVYDLRDAPVPAYFTDWAGAIRLIQTELPHTPLQPGEQFLVNFYLHTIGTTATNLSAVVRLVDATGQEVARDEHWPYGAATSTWQAGQDYVDGHEFTLPAALAPGYLRLELGFYDGEAQKLVMPMIAGTETPRGDFAAVGYIGVGLADTQPTLLKAPPTLGEQVKLIGARLQAGELGDNGNVPRITSKSATTTTLPLTLAWQPLRPTDVDYVTLVHLIAPDGRLAKQYDRAPLQGAAPTTLWHEGDILIDDYAIELPGGLAAGEYKLLVGLYDLPTLTRLPITVAGVAAGDTIQVATVIIP